MKCENCGKREATFYYRSVINGQAQETHLCEECAEKLGYRAGFGVDFGSGFDDLFSLLPRVVGAEDFFDMPRFTPAARRTLRAAGQEQTEDFGLSEKEKAALQKECAVNALQAALSDALAAEDYEKAASLRDELKQLQQE